MLSWSLAGWGTLEHPGRRSSIVPEGTPSCQVCRNHYSGTASLRSSLFQTALSLFSCHHAAALP